MCSETHSGSAWVQCPHAGVRKCWESSAQPRHQRLPHLTMILLQITQITSSGAQTARTSSVSLNTRSSWAEGPDPSLLGLHAAPHPGFQRQSPSTGAGASKICFVPQLPSRAVSSRRPRNPRWIFKECVTYTLAKQRIVSKKLEGSIKLLFLHLPWYPCQKAYSIMQQNQTTVVTFFLN